MAANAGPCGLSHGTSLFLDHGACLGREVMQAAQTYRLRGTTRQGDGTCGVATMAAAELATWVADRFRRGFRDLVVCGGPGPVPPGWDEDSVAEIGPHPETGQRDWWAKTPEEG
jgi:hypothetical protein